MTPAEMDRRIIKSRRTLASYSTFPGPMQGPAENTLAIVRSEINLLNEWAAAFPDKANKILALVDKWEEYVVRLRAKAN